MWDFPRVWINEMKEQRKKKKERKTKERRRQENKRFLHSQKRSEVTVKLLHAGSQDIHCKKPVRKNIDKGTQRKAGRSL